MAKFYEYYYKNIINLFLQNTSIINALSGEQYQGLLTAFVDFDKTFDNIDEVTKYLSCILEVLKSDECPVSRKKPNLLVEKMLDIVNKEFDRDIGLTELADRLSVSETYLSKVFKESMNVNFKEYLTELKITKARELLAQNRYTVKEISEMLGYNSPKNFTRVFKKQEGITPAEYIAR